MEFQVAKGNWRRSFGSLWLAQLQAAFTANAYEFLVIFMLAKEGLSGAETSLRWAVQGIFAAPFILFSMAAGRLADRSSKRTVAVATQIAGVGVLALAASALALGNLPLVLLALFLTGAQGAFFSPAKYGLLPELVPHERLSWANGIMALATFTATILGVLAGGWMSESLTRAWSGGLLVVLALFGVVASLGIARVRAAEPGVKIRLNFVADAVEQFGRARKDRVLFLALAGSTTFWFLGAVVRINTLAYGAGVLGVGPERSGLLLGAMALGIALGSVVAGYASGRKIEYGLIPFGALGMTASLAMLFRTGLTFQGAAASLAALGFSAGFFYVPINALLQHRPAPERKGEVLALASLLSFVAVFLSWPVGSLSARLGLGPE
ncbi:MAG: hypothetical protein DMG07_28865, partial [Acidobacteria bacterium]